MQISVKTANEVTVLAFEGSLDTQTSPDALTQLTQLIEGGDKKIVVKPEMSKTSLTTSLRLQIRNSPLAVLSCLAAARRTRSPALLIRISGCGLSRDWIHQFVQAPCDRSA